LTEALQQTTMNLHQQLLGSSYNIATQWREIAAHGEIETVA
jgi:hypothetical protein